MGKSSISAHFRRLGFPVFDADAAVHELYAKDGAAVEPMRKTFPGAIADEAVDRKALSALVLNNPEALKLVESIVHPLVAAQRRKFFEEASSRGEFLVVYDMYVAVFPNFVA